MSIKNRIVFKGKLKDYPGAEALTGRQHGHSRIEHGPGKGKGCYNM
jgi:hypothetical protein